MKILLALLFLTAVCGDYRIKRSDQPWEVKPNVNGDQHGNVQAGVEVLNKGNDYDFNAGWNKVVHGPAKSKPTWHAGGTIRFKRSPNEPWEVQPNVNGDQHGNVQAGVEVGHKGDDYDFNAGWNKVVHGPAKAKPTWHVGGTLRFKRSQNEPWEVQPNVNGDQHGNVQAGVEVGHKGDDYDFNAGWNKVVHGPAKAKPTWHAGGTIRFKRSSNEPWEVQPNVNGDQHGNVQAGVEVGHKGDDYDFNAGWNKVVHGPAKAKPTWHAGGTIRFKRSPNEPWEVQPNVNGDQHGNVQAGVEVGHKGGDYDFNAGWNKVVHGPAKAKPTWHVGGTIRLKRSPNEPWEVQPNVNGDQHGNVQAGVEVRNKGDDYDFNAGWSKVVRGPAKAKPTWHAGGTIRFKRSSDQIWDVPAILDNNAGHAEDGDVIIIVKN